MSKYVYMSLGKITEYIIKTVDKDIVGNMLDC